MQDYVCIKYLNCIFAFLVEQTIRNKATEDAKDTEYIEAVVLGLISRLACSQRVSISARPEFCAWSGRGDSFIVGILEPA